MLTPTEEKSTCSNTTQDLTKTEKAHPDLAERKSERKPVSVPEVSRDEKPPTKNNECTARNARIPFIIEALPKEGFAISRKIFINPNFKGTPNNILKSNCSLLILRTEF